MRNGPLVVLHGLRPPDGSTKYVDVVVEATPPATRLRFFSWAAALLGGYDVLHLHWPEQLVRDSRRPWRRVVKRRLVDLLLVRLALTRTPLVRTAHNPAPHEDGPRAEQRSLRRLERRVDLVIRLSPVGPVPPCSTDVIRHGHYRHLLGSHPRPPSEPGRLLHFGILRPYKGVGALLDAFGGTVGPAGPDAGGRADVTLRVVGHPHPGQDEVVRAACARDRRITATLRHVDDAELVAEISAAQLVVLPYLGEMHNSGALLAALSLDRPVLVPRSATNTALAEEVGPGWVHQYDGPMTARVLSEALAATASPPGAPPRLLARDPAVQRAGYARAYQRALAVRAPAHGAGSRRRSGGQPRRCW